MEGLKKLGAVYLIGVAVAVAVFFIVNPLLTDAIDVPGVWQALDVLMVVALAIALAANYTRKQGEDGRRPRRVRHPALPGGQRRVLPDRGGDHPVPAQLVLTAGRGDRQPGRQPPGMGHLGRGGHVVLPLIVGITGCRLWRETSSSG